MLPRFIIIDKLDLVPRPDLLGLIAEANAKFIKH
jgi:hypothetical protein